MVLSLAGLALIELHSNSPPTPMNQAPASFPQIRAAVELLNALKNDEGVPVHKTEAEYPKEIAEFAEPLVFWLC